MDQVPNYLNRSPQLNPPGTSTSNVLTPLRNTTNTKPPNHPRSPHSTFASSTSIPDQTLHSPLPIRIHLASQGGDHTAEEEQHVPDKVQVIVRIRPVIAKEVACGTGSIGWEWSENHIRSLPVRWEELTDEEVAAVGEGRPCSFTFDSILGPATTNSQVYDALGYAAVRKVVEGYNATLMAYGQTTSGKTHSMLGQEHGDPGVILLALRDLFVYMGQCQEAYKFKVGISYYEIYGEEINDLLSEADANLIIFEDPRWGPSVKGITKTQVDSVAEVMTLLAKGNERRHVGETEMNAKSSRSHAIFQVQLESSIVVKNADMENSNGDENDASEVNHPAHAEGSIEKESNSIIRRAASAVLKRARKRPLVSISSLTIIDLAGSERVSKTQAKGKRLQEAGGINKSLTALGKVITAINQKAAHVPYRDSKLTRLLTSALGGNSYTSILFCISPVLVHREESRSTLQFALRSSTVTTKAVVNKVETGDAVLLKFRNEIAKLREQLKSKESQESGMMERISLLEARLAQKVVRTFQTPQLARAIRQKPLQLYTVGIGPRGVPQTEKPRRIADRENVIPQLQNCLQQMMVELDSARLNHRNEVVERRLLEEQLAMAREEKDSWRLYYSDMKQIDGRSAERFGKATQQQQVLYNNNANSAQKQVTNHKVFEESLRQTKEELAAVRQELEQQVRETKDSLKMSEKEIAQATARAELLEATLEVTQNELCQLKEKRRQDSIETDKVVQGLHKDLKHKHEEIKSLKTKAENGIRLAEQKAKEHTDGFESKLQELVAENAEKAFRLETALKQCASLEQELQASRTRVREAEEMLKAEKLESATRRSQTEKMMRSRQAELSSEVDRLGAEVKEYMESTKASKERENALEDKTSKLQEENARLLAEVQKAISIESSLRAVIEKKTSSLIESEGLHRRLAQGMAVEKTHFNATLERFKAELDRVNTAMREKEKLNVAIDKELQACAKQLDLVRQENSRIQQKLETSEKLANNRQRSLEAAKARVGVLKQAFTNLLADVPSMLKMVNDEYNTAMRIVTEALQKRCDVAERMDRLKDDYSADLDQVEEDLAKVDTKVEDALRTFATPVKGLIQTDGPALMGLKRALFNQANKLDALSKQAKGSQSELSKSRQEFVAKVAAWEEQDTETESLVQKLREELKEGAVKYQSLLRSLNVAEERWRIEEQKLDKELKRLRLSKEDSLRILESKLVEQREATTTKSAECDELKRDFASLSAEYLQLLEPNSPFTDIQSLPEDHTAEQRKQLVTIVQGAVKAKAVISQEKGQEVACQVDLDDTVRSSSLALDLLRDVEEIESFVNKLDAFQTNAKPKCSKELFREDLGDSLEARVGKVRNLFSQVLNRNPATPGIDHTQTPVSVVSMTPPISLFKPEAAINTSAKRQIEQVICGNKELSDVLRESESGQETLLSLVQIVNEAEDDMRLILERVQRQNQAKESHLEKLQQVKARMELLLLRSKEKRAFRKLRKKSKRNNASREVETLQRTTNSAQPV